MHSNRFGLWPPATFKKKTMGIQDLVAGGHGRIRLNAGAFAERP